MSDSTITPRMFQLQAIGTVQQSGDTFQVVIDAPYRPALKQLEHFSHVIVFWWADQGDTPEYRQFLQAEPPYAPGVTTGVFATRSPLRPNPVAITTCAILGVDEEAGIVRIGWIDAFDGTPV
ncbi:MAG: SAM-dependent methyltransferase, partial [Anaerolineae bacterium]|nr:SAM-dependent methyltransferase [Anaerolineae bacterium]